MSAAYYNEFDPKAAAWLAELMKEGLIPDGKIDTRSIADVQPDDLRDFTQCHFFAGIGGWSYALRLAGWPDDKPVWTGSCPCQPFSCAGKGLAADDDRHLWPVFRELIRACKPPTVFGEQVASKAGRDWLAGVFADLEGMAYQRAGADLCAASLGAPHIRQRLFWMAHAQHPERWPIRFPGKNGRNRKDPGREEAHRQPRTCGQVRRLADAELRRSEQRNAGQRAVSEPHANGADSGLGDMQQQGLERHAGNGDDRHQPGRDGAEPTGSTAPSSCAGFWSDAIWHECRDGKARRISPEPALFPLAYGLPGRVGLLRGAGNAIVPEVAAQFIRAAEEAIGDL